MKVQIVRKSIMGRRVLGGRARFSLALIVFMAMFLAACAQTEGKDPESASVSSGTEYTQTVIDFPEGAHISHSLEKTSSGKLWMVSTNDNSDADTFISSTSLWELNNDNSWKEVVNFNELLALDEGDYISASHITKNNQVLCFVINNEDYSSGMRFYLVDPELEGYRELKIDTSEFIGEPTLESLYGAASQFCSLPNDQFLIQNASASLFVLDIVSETIKPVRLQEGSKEWYLIAATAVDETVYVLLQHKTDHISQKISTLDISSGTYSDLDVEKHGELVELFNDRESFGVATVSTFKADDDLKRITFCHSDGIFEYSNNEVKKIADAEDTILSNPAQRVMGCVFENQDDYFILCNDYSSGSATSSPFSLYKHEKLDAPIEISNTLRVYALEDSDTVRQAISLFTDEHSNVEVKLEIGLDNEGKTTEDAIKSLNTELLAGSGPDVFILDGLPIDDLSKQGVFHDLTDIYTEAKDSGQYYENLISSFISEGKCEVLPMRYSFPLVFAEKDTADRLDSLSTLQTLAEEMISTNSYSKVFCNMAIFDEMFIASYPVLFAQEELNEEVLMQFFESVGSLSKLLKPNDKQSSVLPNPGKKTHDANEVFDDSGFGQVYLLEDPHQILLFEPLWEQQFLENEVFVQNNKADLVNGAFSLNGYTCFTPQVCVAVNANGKEIELSKSFVQMMLSEKCQAINHRDGLSIMGSVFDSAAEMGFGVTLMDGSQLGIPHLSEETAAAYQSIFSSLDTPVVIDRVVRTAIFEEMQRYLDGEVALEGAVDACSKKINIYLAE